MNLYSRMKIFWIEKEKITFMIFASIQIILCDGANSYVDVNAWDEIQGFLVYCLYFKLEWSS